MKLYLECSMGASGDMLMSALYELLPEKGIFCEKMERLGLPGVTLEYAASTKCGITGTHITVLLGDAEEKSIDVKKQDDGFSSFYTKKQGSGASSLHAKKQGDGPAAPLHVKQKDRHPVSSAPLAPPTSYRGITELISSLDLPDNVSGNALGVFRVLGEAEAAVHGVPLESIHFHEIGALDAVADIVGCCLLINMLGVTDITASPVNTGFGSVLCEHGILPVPSPAAAEILKGVPIYGGRVEGELCTPTGAALLKHFAKRFGEMPPMTVAKIGYGMGAKDFEAANCLRAFLSEDDEPGGKSRDVVYEISCNLDDMTPEAIGAAFELLLENGALDVYTIPIMMKKCRPAVMLSCLCGDDKRDKLARLILEHTSTFGVRISAYHRDALKRAVEAVPTQYGEIRVKYANGSGAEKHKPEYDDVVAAAKRHGVPFATVYNATLRAVDG